MLKGIRGGRRDFMSRERRIMWEELRGTKEEVYYKYEIKLDGPRTISPHLSFCLIRVIPVSAMKPEYSAVTRYGSVDPWLGRSDTSPDPEILFII